MSNKKVSKSKLANELNLQEFDLDVILLEYGYTQPEKEVEIDQEIANKIRCSYREIDKALPHNPTDINSAMANIPFAEIAEKTNVDQEVLTALAHTLFEVKVAQVLAETQALHRVGLSAKMQLKQAEVKAALTQEISILNAIVALDPYEGRHDPESVREDCLAQYAPILERCREIKAQLGKI